MRDIRKVHGGANAPPQAERADVRHMQDEAQAALSAQGAGRALAGKGKERRPARRTGGAGRRGCATGEK